MYALHPFVVKITAAASLISGANRDFARLWIVYMNDRGFCILLEVAFT